METPFLRKDLALLADWIRPNSHVLDLGCGDGTFLAYLHHHAGVVGYGVEIDTEKVLACVENGVNVIQADLEEGLSLLAGAHFDYVILSQTLQAVRHTERILVEMLKMGTEGIVTFPNFGYWQNRMQILQGHMPVSEHLPYQWYDTPNLHLCTIDDFENLCSTLDIDILERCVMHAGQTVQGFSNWRGSLGVFRLRKKTAAR